MPILDIDCTGKRDEALGRIGYFVITAKLGRVVDYRKLLTWFVRWARTDMARLHPTALRELHEEILALQEESSGGSWLGVTIESTAKHAPGTQATVAKHLAELTATGRTEFDSFAIFPAIDVPRFRGLPSFPYGVLSSEIVDPANGKAALYLFFLALKYAGDRLRQCQPCGRVFVQVRRRQLVCSPRCRMRSKRQRDAQPTDTDGSRRAI